VRRRDLVGPDSSWYHLVDMTDRARKLLQDALTLSDDERLDLAEQIMSSIPADAEWLARV
jgi:hypothetical protein